MDTYIKILIVAALLLIPIFLGIKHFIDTAYQSPLPLDPAVTLGDFFTCLQDKPDDDFFRARELLDSEKINHINENFDRIRNYLIERVGPDFASNLQVEPGASFFQAKFKNGIILRCKTGAKWGLDEKTHFTLQQILDFRQDYFPTLGAEQRNRQLDQIMDSVTNPNAEFTEEVDDIQSALEIQPGEPPSVRLKRLVNSFHYSYMLDIRHPLFDAILEEFPNDPVTMSFLREITAEDYDVAIHLKNQAQKIIEPQSQPIIK